MHYQIGKWVHKTPFPEKRGIRKVLDLRRKISDFNYRGIRLRYNREKGIKFQIDINSGAGYQLGYSAFLALYCKGRKNLNDSSVRFPIQIGFTQNANKVPYVY